MLASAVVLGSMAKAADDGTGAGGAPPAPAADEGASARERVTLALGQAVEIDGGRLTAGIIAIDDQRCPMTLRCRWPGDAWLKVRLMTQAGAKAEVVLDTTGDARAARFAGYTLTLLALEPYPQTDTPIEGADYRATVLISRD